MDTLLNPGRAEPTEAWKLRLAAVDHALANGDGAVRLGEDGRPGARREIAGRLATITF